MTRLVPILLAVAMLAACSGGGGGEGSAANSRTTQPDLRPADEVRQADDVAAALGELVELDNGLAAAVLGAEPRTVEQLEGRTPTEPDTSWLVIHARIENRSSDAQYAPDLSVACSDGREGNWYVYEHPDELSAEALPPATQDEGLRLFGIPDGCSAMTVTAAATGAVAGEPIVGRWQLP